MSQENVETVREAWDAWLRGDMDALFASYFDRGKMTRVDAFDDRAEALRTAGLSK